MKKNTRFTFRQLLFAAIFLLAFIAITIFLFTYRRDQHLFDKISSQLFQEEMTANTLNMHYTLANPDNFGIYDYKPILPCYSAENRLTSQAETENLISILNSLNTERLSDSDSYTKSLLLHSLDNSLAMSQYTYYDEPLSPSSGMQSQLPILLAEYTFRTKQDIEDYLSLLDQTDEYFASLLTFEQEKADAGLLMPSVSLEKVRTQCLTILTEQSLRSGTHFLQTTFKERLQTLYSQGDITKEEAIQFMTRNTSLLSGVMLPAYEKLSDGLLMLEKDSIPVAGLASKPDGASYYEHLLISETGSSRPVSEIKEMLGEKFNREYEAIKELITQNPSLAALSYDTALEKAFPFRDASQMLADLQQRMQNDFPAFNTSAQSLPSVTVKTVSESLQDYCAPAFYLTPPLDDTSANVIYINEKSTMAGLELYTTLAHEGYPGHMYQSVFSNQTQMSNKDSHVRQILWYGGYQEGWALYVEFTSFDYASALMKEQGRDDLALCIQLEKHNRSLQLCLYSLLDIMIHYDNASYQQITKVLNSFGIEEESSVTAIYQYIVEEPANYLKYYLGYLEILTLRQELQTLWGSSYSDLNFHTRFLECGPSDFSTLKNHLVSEAHPDVPKTALGSTISVWFGRNGLRSAVLSPK